MGHRTTLQRPCHFSVQAHSREGQLTATHTFEGTSIYLFFYNCDDPMDNILYLDSTNSD